MKQIDVQNALRVLQRVVPLKVSIEFDSNDMVIITDHSEEGTNKVMRTQDAAEYLFDESAMTLTLIQDTIDRIQDPHDDNRLTSEEALHVIWELLKEWRG